MTSVQRGFTLVDLVASVAALALLGFAVAGFSGCGRSSSEPKSSGEKADESKGAPSGPAEAARRAGPRRPMSTAKQLKDATNQRQIHQAMVIFANSNSDAYPLPSLLDRADHTVKIENPAQKDDTKNIFSVLIYNGMFTPETVVSPEEINSDIAVDEDYQFDAPEGAAGTDRKLALWDPRFKGPPSAGYQGCRGADKGNVSYAHLPPIGARRKFWMDSFESTRAITSTRGGWFELAGDATSPWRPGSGEARDCLPYEAARGRTGGESITLVERRGTTSWEGNVCFNDGHTEFITRADPETLTFTFTQLPASRRTQPDNLFANENDLVRTPDTDSLEGDAAKNTNNYLRLYANMAPPRDGGTVSLKGAWFAD